MKTYVFLSNIMYNSTAVRRVRWWHKLFGFSGEYVVAEFETEEKDHFRAAVLYFRRQGYEAQVMGMKMHEDIV